MEKMLPKYEFCSDCGTDFICNDCGALFGEPKAVQEDRGEFWGMPACETMYYCPHCGSDDFEEYEEE